LRIALTGSEGFTGRHFAAAAARAGHDVIPFRANLVDREAVMREAGTLRADAFVHLAAISFVGHQDERAFYDVNLFGTLNLLEGVSKMPSGCRRALIASSANVYGNSTHSPIPESEAPAPVNHYAMSKLAMELMVQARFAQLPALIVRPFNYTGPGQAKEFVIPKLVDHFRRRATKVPLGNVHVMREYNDVRFVCDAYLRLLEVESPPSVCNVCTGVMHDFNTVIDTLRELTGHAIEVETDPRLVRPNELHRLCGDPSRLRAAIGDGATYTLRDTLEWMLGADD
jgi:nucleoside-diphosphate-sugar epimerase